MKHSLSPNNITLDDIVFEGRNRAYGAYFLRKKYPSHLRDATILAVLTFLLLLTASSLIPQKPVTLTKKKLDNGHTVTPVVLPAVPVEPAGNGGGAIVEPPSTTPPVQTTQTNTTELVNPVVVDNATPVPTTKPATNAAPATTSMPIDAPPGLGDGTGTGEATGSGTGVGTAAPVVDKPFIYVEQMPEFSGGDLLTYVTKRIVYPSMARELKVEGLVIVSFVVAANGNIEQIKLEKGLGAGLDEEVLRVVKSLPKWKPGYQNGNAVPVKMTLPIRFSLKK